jgi:hypothetical protein
MTEGLFPSAPPSEPPPAPNTEDRAFELARSGSYVTIEQIVDQLKVEQHERVDALLFDPGIRLALRQACAEGRQSASRARLTGLIQFGDTIGLHPLSETA